MLLFCFFAAVAGVLVSSACRAYSVGACPPRRRWSGLLWFGCRANCRCSGRPHVSPVGGLYATWKMLGVADGARCFVALQLFCRLCALMLPLDNASSARVFGCSHSLPIPPSVREKKKHSFRINFFLVQVWTATSLCLLFV